MADRRVTDLSYGHLGKASYDTDEHQWTFSSAKHQDQRVQQLLPLKQQLAPSTQNALKQEGKPSKIAKSQLQQLHKTQPETFPANQITHSLVKVHDTNRAEFSSRSGSLLVAARAVDVHRISGSRKPRILCLSCGGAGHILQLIRPRMERRGWGKHSAVSLSLFEMESADQAYWVGTGGAIRQVESSNDENESGTWLAVRQDSIVTILRPLYGNLYKPKGPTIGYQQARTPSLLSPNPVCTLTTDKTKSELYADVSFNPWYARQFAVVDTKGHWCIWDLERLYGKGSPEQLTSGKNANFYKGHDPDPDLKDLQNNHYDGWYRIFWACNINTIVVCNRRHVAAFDIKSAPSRLSKAEIFTKNSEEWIVDVKRSPVDSNHIFILTTSRIYWVQVVPAREDDGDQDLSTGVKVILSHRHFRDSNDDTIRITLFKKDKVTACVFSAKSRLVTFYCFWTSSDAPGVEAASTGSFTLSSESEEVEHHGRSFQTLCNLPADLISTSTIKNAGPEFQYLEQDVNFFQLWALSTDLRLYYTLLSVLSSSSEQIVRPKLPIMAPATKVSHASRPQGPRVIHEAFIVSDNMERSGRDASKRHTATERDDLRFTLNWKTIFEYVFETQGGVIDLPELLSRVEEDMLGGGVNNRTLHEISSMKGFSGDLEEAASGLHSLLDSLRLLPSPTNNLTVVVSDLTDCPSTRFLSDQEHDYPELLKIYNQMAENWIASLPLKLSPQARLSKFRLVRQVALELCLSCFGVSLRDVASDITTAPVKVDDVLVLPDFDTEDATTRESSPAIFSSEMALLPGRESDFHLPTPARTPSLYSHATSVSELKEDPAISRLRQYAVSLNAKPDFGKAAILSQWPSTPGADPAQFSWQATQRAAAEDDGDGERRNRNHKEEARRRRRTEKFLRQEQAQAAEPLSQPMVVIPSGSQPAFAHNGFSSQPVDDIPMTQPDRGAFGSRLAQPNKKKKKKQRAAGF